VGGTDTGNGLESFGETRAALKAGLAGTGAEIAGALLPGFEAIAGAAEEYLGQFSDIVRNAGGDVGAMADGIGGLLGQIATDLAGSAPQMLQAGLGIVQGLIDAILQALPALIPAAVGIITSLVEFLVANLPLIIDAGVQLLLALVNGILPMLPMLIDQPGAADVDPGDRGDYPEDRFGFAEKFAAVDIGGFAADYRAGDGADQGDPGAAAVYPADRAGDF